MDAVTYPDPRVAETLDHNFVPVKLTITDGKPSTEKAMERYNLVWTPTLIVLDDRGREIRRSVGWLSPEEMLAELKMGLGAYFVSKNEFGKALDWFQRVVREHPDSKHSPEALYWSGMAQYERDQKPEALMTHWHQLRDRYPDSEWWGKASFIDRK